LHESLGEKEWPAVCLYIHLVAEKLTALTEDEPYNSKASRIAERASSVATSYEKTVNTSMRKKFTEEYFQLIRSIAWCVQTADLHRVTARREREIEELAGEPVHA
jgi:hypothetical protein